MRAKPVHEFNTTSKLNEISFGKTQQIDFVGKDFPSSDSTHRTAYLSYAGEIYDSTELDDGD